MLCVSVLIWSCGLQWHFLRSQFWLNRVGVYKVIDLIWYFFILFYRSLMIFLDQTYSFIYSCHYYFFIFSGCIISWILLLKSRPCKNFLLVVMNHSNSLIRVFWNVKQVVVLVLMVISTAASSFGLSDLRGINVSMYIRLLVPIVFSR